MTFEQVAIVLLVLLIAFREVITYLQLRNLQELLKSNDISEYYRAKDRIKEMVSSTTNTVMDEANPIAEQSVEDFDIRKVSEVIIDGEKRPIKIIS